MYPMGIITRRAASAAMRPAGTVAISPAIQNAAMANVRAVRSRPRMGMWVAGAGVAGLTAGVVGEMR
ncbi:hypothetical protein HDV00_012439 [Rhizophlyctis rosea]|nr:hypothetical protein HDV00_012439 [Rhizophlyctis rosea]